jgi:2-hydroxychromene-2-carboxylate isomerase
VPIQIAFDYRCGYSYKMARYVRELRSNGASPDVEWLPFSLEQVNEEHGDGVYLWEHPEIPTGSFLGLAAGRWIERRSPEAFETYHYAAFTAMHDEERALDRDTVLALAKDAGADVAPLEEAIDTGAAIRAAGAEYVRLYNEHGVFGTPTLIFPDGTGLYVRLHGVWEDDAHRRRVWDQIAALVAEPIVSEIKRTVPPEPEACVMPIGPVG